MRVYFAGEDEVTKEIAKRLIRHCMAQSGLAAPELEEISPRLSGRRALEKIEPMMRLAEKAVVVAVLDADTNCAISLLKRYAPDGWKKPFGAVNFAIDEAESWLMSDRRGIAKFLGVGIGLIPRKPRGRPELSDAVTYKTSLYILNELAPHTSKAKIKTLLSIAKTLKKPATYNAAWPLFIQRGWNVEEAMKNSQSLRRAVARISGAMERYGQRLEGPGTNDAEG